MVREKLKAKFLLIVVLGVFLTTSPAVAFFVGNLEIKSKFGENFEASFEIHLDNNGGYEVALGDAADYEKLGLTRQPLMNSLALEKPITAAGEKKVIRVFSNIPLFFPSFNLVVIARHNGGTLLENFLVTVDFKQGLAINALGKKKKKTTSDSVNPPHVKKEVTVEKKPLPSNQGKAVPGQEVTKLPQEPEVNEIPPHKSMAINPTPVVNRLQNRRRLSGAIWAAPKKVFPLVNLPVSEKKDEAQRDAEVSRPGDFIKLERGDGLFSVARKIKTEGVHPSRIAVALWMKNIDKFIYGNIHGIQADTELNKVGIKELASKIDLQTAKNILKSQAREWEITKEKVEKVEEIEKDIQEIPLPVERIDQVTSIFSWIGGWKSSWEAGDIDQHISYYHENLADKPKQISAQESTVWEKKKKLFLKYPNPSLSISSQNLISRQGGSWIIFEQHFYSKKMESVGTKEVKVSWEKGDWKIDEEKFYAEKHEVTESILKEKSKKGRPFVIHVSSHSRETEAVTVSNKLRENGYDSYTAPVRISKGINIYRVYIGRFMNWDQAHRMTKTLRRKKLAGHATVIPYPFTLNVGEVNSIVEARQLLEKLRTKGISGFLSVSSGRPGEGSKLEVFVGAFKKPENAVWLKQQLKESGFSFKQVSP